MRVLLGVVIAFAACVAACSASAPEGEAGFCAHGAALSATGLCPEQASSAMDAARLTGGPALEGPAANCSWTFRDVAIGDGGEALVYRAMVCRGAATTFAYSGGAHSAALSYETSALGHPAGREAARIFVSDPQNPTQVIENLTSDLPADERAKCEVRPANIAGWPRGALVIGYNAAAAATLPTGEPHAVCGAYGLNEDEMKFWLVRDGYAYFFSLGQDGLDFDPNSVTLFRRGEDGVWAPAAS